MTFREIIALIALAAVWGGSFLFIRIAAVSFGPFALMAARVLIAALVLGVLMTVRRKKFDLRRHAADLAFLGLANAAIPFTLIAFAELRLTASLAAMLNASVPLFTAPLGALWLGERLTRHRVLGLLLGVIGVTVLVGWSRIEIDTATLLSVAAMLLATFCYAISGVYAKRRLTAASPMTLALGQQLFAGAWLIGPALWLHPTHLPDAGALWAVLGLGVLSTALAYMLYFYLIASVGPTRTYTVTYLIPFFGILWGAWFLGESITSGMFAGLVCIVGSLILVNNLGFVRTLPKVMSITSNETRTMHCREAEKKMSPLSHPLTDLSGLLISLTHVMKRNRRRNGRDVKN